MVYHMNASDSQPLIHYLSQSPKSHAGATTPEINLQASEWYQGKRTGLARSEGKF